MTSTCFDEIFSVKKILKNDDQWSITILYHTNYCRQNIVHKKGGHSMANAGFEIKIVVKSGTIEIVFKSWGRFRIYQLISTDNRPLCVWNWTGLAVPIS